MRFVGVAVAMGVVAAMLFVPAGRIDVPAFWAWLVALFGSGTLCFALLARFQPELMRERIQPPSDRDRASRRIAAPLFTAHLVVAGLDLRWGWSAVPLVVQVIGGLAFIGAFALVIWTLMTNPYASSAVRIQEDRGQTVISHGPYAWVRHPMYFAVVLISLGSGPFLGSWLAAPILWPLIGVFVRRTLIEDRMLQEELPGYVAYAERVRWRVVPGIF